MVDEKMCIKSMLSTDIDRLKSVVSTKLDDLYEKHDVTVSIKKTDILDLISMVHNDVDDLIIFIKGWQHND